jgi:hypothetical protein
MAHVKLRSESDIDPKVFANWMKQARGDRTRAVVTPDELDFGAMAHIDTHSAQIALDTDAAFRRGVGHQGGRIGRVRCGHAELARDSLGALRGAFVVLVTIGV